MINVLDILEPEDFILVDEDSNEVLILGDLIPHENVAEKPYNPVFVKGLPEIKHHDYSFDIDYEEPFAEEAFDEE